MLIKFTKIAILLSFVFSLSINFALPVYAAGLNFKPQIGIGGEFTKGANVAVSNSTETIGEYIKQIYKYAIGIVGIVAVIVMMVGGVLWMTAGGNPTQVSSAQQYITGALTGLVLVMFSYVILKTVNPDLINFQTHTIASIEMQKIAETNISGFKTGACCTTAEECGAGYTCNTSVNDSECPGKGHCVVTSGQAENTICDPQKTNECKPPLICVDIGSGHGRCLYDNYYSCGDGSQICRTECNDWHSGGTNCPGGMWCCEI